jgi:hypothetical protein
LANQMGTTGRRASYPHEFFALPLRGLRGLRDEPGRQWSVSRSVASRMFAVCPSPTGQAGRIRKNNAFLPPRERRHYEPSACVWLAPRFDSASGVCSVPVRAYSFSSLSPA